jgi:hypothetical protein
MPNITRASKTDGSTMSIQEYLFRKWQAQGLTAMENEALTYLADLDPIRQGELETEWFNEQKKKSA